MGKTGYTRNRGRRTIPDATHTRWYGSGRVYPWPPTYKAVILLHYNNKAIVEIADFAPVA